ncbi:25S rRNA (adenine2142-N1)-methyltransferase [Sporothrix stenoceras]|uniref:25S rRNA adenine-N(1) methyltransferase n=1 Tax=Sporothrix stenoceras TaxID=5173 RepID=A0ABR3YN52_9PEZI
MGARKKTPILKSLSAGRPPTARPPKSISRKTTKKLINSHHQLEKRRLQAVARNDKAAEIAIAAEIEALGGLARYQQASLQGQHRERGGDSSRVLMQWLGIDQDEKDKAARAVATKTVTAAMTAPEAEPSFLKSAPLRMLEVGALSIDNACSVSGCFQMERIDLNSQGPGILQQDFLQRPRPTSDKERFDIISLSLVLNYVPQHSDRGEMLLRCLDFLHEPGMVSTEGKSSSKAGSAPATDDNIQKYFPSVFMVLPEPCVANSRYLTKEHLTNMMNVLGFDLLESKTSQRLVYYLWARRRPASMHVPRFIKKELRSGPTRNNFSIVLQGT